MAHEVLPDLYHFTESQFETVGGSTPVFYSESPYRQINWQCRMAIGRSTGGSLPPNETVIDGRSGIGRCTIYIISLRAHEKQSACSSSGQEWQIYIPIVRAHIGRLGGRSTPLGRSASGIAIADFYC